jgi:hypothetical protein
MLLTAVVKNNRSPAITGEECASPGTFTLNKSPSPFTASHLAGRFIPTATPEAYAPRKDGQSAAEEMATDEMKIIEQTNRDDMPKL